MTNLMRSCALVVALALTTTACGSAVEDGSLQAAFSGCSVEGEGISADFTPFVPTLAETVMWISAETVSAGKRTPWVEADGAYDATTVADTDGRSHDIEIHNSAWPGIDWAVEREVPILIAARQGPNGLPRATVVVIETDDGLVFVGDCADRWARASLEAQYGSQYEDVFLQAVGKTGSELQTFLAQNSILTGQTPPPEPIVYLHPGEVPKELVSELRPIAIAVELADGSQPNLMICPKLGAGWLDCVVATESGTGFVISGYHDESGEMEFWLIDEEGGLREPYQRLGVIKLPLDHVASDDAGLVVEVSLERGQVTLVKVLSGDEFDAYVGAG